MDEYTDANPPAFPRNHRHNGHNGMSLRDWFAGQALASVMSTAQDLSNADAMLAERTVVGRS